MKSLSRNIIFNLSGNLFVILYSILLLPIVLNTLGSEAAGVIGLYNTIFTTLAFFDLGFGILANREISKNSANFKLNRKTLDLVNTLEVLYWFISIIIFVIIFFSASFISENILESETFNKTQLTYYLRLIAISILFRWPISFYFNINSGLQNLVGINIIKMILYFLLMFSLYYLIIVLGYNIGEYLTIIAITNFLLVMSYLFSSKRKLGFKKRLVFKTNSLKGHLTYALGSMMISTLTLFLLQLDKIYLTSLGNLSNIGLYTVLFSLSIGVVQLIYPLTGAFFPKINELIASNKKDELLSKIEIVSSILIIISFLVLILFFSFKEEILAIWIDSYNNKEIQDLFLILVIASCTYTIVQIPFLVESALGKVKFVMISFLMINIIYTVILYFFINGEILRDIANTYLLIITLYFVCGLYLLYKNLGKLFTLKWLIEIIKYILLSIGIVFIIRNIKIEFNELFFVIIQMAILMSIVLIVLIGINKKIKKYSIYKLRNVYARIKSK